MSHKYYLSLGGNLAAESALPSAVARLQKFGKVLAVSSVYETPPAGTVEPQPNYLNAAVLIESKLSPIEFQQRAIADVEADLGRIRTDDKFAARTIDIDIMLVDSRIMMIEHRKIPSMEITERDFVAIPLAEIAPDYVHPESHKTLDAIASEFRHAGTAMKLRQDVYLGHFPDPG